MDAKGYISSDAGPASKPYIFSIFLRREKNENISFVANPALFTFYISSLTASSKSTPRTFSVKNTKDCKPKDL